LIKNKLSLGIVFSICLHLTLFIFINQQFKEKNFNPIVTKSSNKKGIIKSFLYQRPVELPELEISKFDVSRQNKHVIIVTDDTKSDITPIPKNSTHHKNLSKKPIVSKSKPVKTQIEKASVSALSLLSKLRKKLDEKSIEQVIHDRQRSLAAKIMAGAAPVVPHSIRVETRAEKVKRTAISMNHFSSTVIFKDDNGICTTIRDLSKLGMDIRTELTQSRCGLSKFDKSFKKHMSSVIEKLMNK
jgi:hypothetical protein